MSQPLEFGYHDQELIRYLVGLLPEEDAERLDAASIADEEVAARLRIVEKDLVDAYVRGALTGPTLERFESWYLSSPLRREHVKFARSFLGAVDRAVAPAGTERDSTRRPPTADGGAPRPRLLPPRWMTLRSKVGLQFAAIAATLVLAVGTVIFQAVQLRKGLSLAHTESAALDLRARELERQLGDQREAHAAIVKELERVRESTAAATRPAAAAPPARAGAARDTLMTALVLLPQTRDSGPMATFAIPPGADHVPFQLRLESDDFRQYQVGLKDPATNEIVWRSGWITASAPGDWPSVPVDVPAGKLKAQHYSLDLMGREAAGTAEVVGSYAFQISRR